MDAPNYMLSNILVLVLGFGCYFLGILVRCKGFPGPKTPRLSQQLWMSILVAPLTLGAMVPVIQASMTSLGSALLMIGLIIEQGAVVNETATAVFQQAMQGRGSIPPATPN